VILVGPDFTPIAMQPGAVHSLDHPSTEAITVFTGRRGQMRAQGFKPGKYELRLFDEKWEPLRFEIPEANDGVYEMGKMQMRLRSQ
jgi:outer membrane usher protein